MNIQEFAELEKNNWFKCTHEAFKRTTNINSDIINDLVCIGLPKDAAPYLNFSFKSNKKFLNQNCPSNDLEKILSNLKKEHFVIGFNGGGDFISINISTNEVVIISHEDLTFVEMNSSLKSMYSCIIAYAEFIKNVQTKYGNSAYINGDYTIDDVETLKNELLKSDSIIALEDNFWNIELTCLIEDIE